MVLMFIRVLFTNHSEPEDVLKKLLLSLFAVLGMMLVAGWIIFYAMQSTRPPAPPAGSPISYPRGAMHLDDDDVGGIKKAGPKRSRFD